MSTTYVHKQSSAQKKDAPSASSVLDASSQSESLQRKADMANNAAQRVVQRDTGVVQREKEYSEKFRYVDYNDVDGIINMPGKICFSKYQNGETKSANFSGCIMMAFRFIRSFSELKSTGIFESESEINKENISGELIAHVYCDSTLSNDTKSALLEAETDELIAIDVLFKPKTLGDGEKILIKQVEGNGHDFFTGGLTFTPGSSPQNGSWNAAVYAQNENVYNRIKPDYSQRDDDTQKLKFFDNNALIDQTRATRAFVYASLGKYNDMKKNFGEENENIFNIFLELCSLSVLKQMMDDKIFEGENEKSKKEGVISKLVSLENQDNVRKFFTCAAFKNYDEMYAIMTTNQDKDDFRNLFLKAYENSNLQDMIGHDDGEPSYDDVRIKIGKLCAPKPSHCILM